jgi:hypothetical protein
MTGSLDAARPMTTVADAMMRNRVTFLNRAVTACVLAAVVAGCGANEGATSESGDGSTTLETTATTAPVALTVGESATVDDVVVTVVTARVTDTINEGLARGRFLVLDVTLTNGGDNEVAYSPPSWSLLAGSAAIRAYPTADVGRLEFGTLAPGATVGGTVGFDLGGAEGPAQVQYRPPRSDAVAAWAVSL